MGKEQNERIKRIVSMIASCDDNALQELFKRAAENGISSAVIIRIWYGQADLSKQPQSVINFFEKELLDISGNEIFVKREVVAFYQQNKFDFAADESVPASARKRCGSLFDMLRNAEREANRDIAEMTKEEFIKAFQSLGFYNRQYIFSALGYLRHYFEWSVNTGRPVSRSWLMGERVTADDIDISLAIQRLCYKDEWALLHKLDQVWPSDEMNPAGPMAVLIFMGFNAEEALELRNEDVDLLKKTVAGRPVPPPLWPVIAQYHQVGDCVVTMTRSNGKRKNLYIEDLGFYLKARNLSPTVKGLRPNYTSVTRSMNDIGLFAKDIKMSGWYRKLRLIDETRRITIDDVCEICEISGDRDLWGVRNQIDDRLIEYHAYVKAFY